MEAFQQIMTGQTFASEPEAWAVFDELVLKSECFGLHREVCGFYMQPRPQSQDRTPRIDRILTPRPKLIDAGWPHGPIGVECKTSGKKIGPVIAQAQDYSRAIWFMPQGWQIRTQWIFLWPLDGAGGDLGSVMAQSCVGWIRSSARTPLVFGCGGTHGISIFANGHVEAKQLPMGCKTGSR